jgi:hypothetical protein
MAIKGITTATENHVQEYCKKIEKKYDIEYSELYDIWKGIPGPYEIMETPSKKVQGKTPKGKRPPTGWNIFCSENRAQVKEENPGLSAPEITKILGEMWGELNQEEKGEYSGNVSEISSCTHILISGFRVGEQCGQKATQGGKCTRHFNMINGTNKTSGKREKKESPKKEGKKDVIKDAEKGKKITDILTLKKDRQGNIIILILNWLLT